MAHGTGIILTPKSYIFFQQVSTLAGSATSLRFKSGCPGRTEDVTNTHQQNFLKKGNTANQTHLVSLPPKTRQNQTLPNLLSQKNVKILSSRLGTKDRVTYHSCQAALEACPSLSGQPLALPCTHGHRVHLGLGAVSV